MGDFPFWLRAQHLLNFFLIGLLLRSGWQIIATHPRFYWRNDCGPGTEWIKFTKRVVPPEEGAFMARDDESELPSWLALPGGKNIGLGRHWHGVVTLLWLLNGFVYVFLLFATGLWRRIIPTSFDVFPEAWREFVSYIQLQVPSIEHYQPYGALQQLAYTAVLFVFAPLMMVTGPIMSPAVIGRFPWYPKLFGGRQAARSIHFLGMVAISIFVVTHVAMVFLVHRQHNILHMVFGSSTDTSRYGVALMLFLATIVLVVSAWIAISYLSLIDIRKTQKFLFAILEPVRRLTVNKFASRTRQLGTYTEADISPYHWSNGRHPTPEESPEWTELAQNDFRDFVLEIGPPENPVRVTGDEMKALPQQTQIAMHTCMQGWTGIAKWTGPKVMDLMALGGERPADAQYLMVTSFGYAQKMHGDKPLEPYYSCIPLADCMEDESIFAWEMNDKPLPWTFGAPMRIRIESIHGYKMVKYIRRVEWIHDYSSYGDGMGGTREDSGYQVINARI